MPQSDTFSRAVIDSPVGPITLEASERGLRAIRFGREAATSPNSSEPASIAAARKQLSEYFAGKRRQFDLPLDWHGTPFQQAVWHELQRIPYGHTCSYGDIARSIGHPRSFRAVGAANGSNPFPIVIPCHRVIGSSGALTGYSGRGGLVTKAQLLALESGS